MYEFIFIMIIGPAHFVIALIIGEKETFFFLFFITSEQVRFVCALHSQKVCVMKILHIHRMIFVMSCVRSFDLYINIQYIYRHLQIIFFINDCIRKMKRRHAIYTFFDTHSDFLLGLITSCISCAIHIDCREHALMQDGVTIVISI